MTLRPNLDACQRVVNSADDGCSRNHGHPEGPPFQALRRLTVSFVSRRDACSGFNSVVRDRIVAAFTTPAASIERTNSMSFSLPASNLLTARSAGDRHRPTVPPVFSLSRRTTRATPPGGKRSGLRSYPVRIVAERLVERRELSDRPIDQICQSGVVGGVAIDFHRAEQVIGSIGKGSEQRLAADDYDLATPRDAAARAKNVLKLLDVHRRTAGRFPSAPGAKGRRRRGCSGEGAVPAPRDREGSNGFPATPAVRWRAIQRLPATGRREATGRTSPEPG